ncbi:hypothetical protein Jab_1c08070 [Janthinobacterium sp. HH01]|uniref:hypothetical protein n=1 Tax=Janthinobacterium sp. HH01 TaxID=1198452 RepID=UPI0002AEACF4|nr:hypothetical protein [Janthinobacterium sp. HH01]ELX12213.1 hypothetical protein Jab_1c08070 [Janthinobacterium sp. HH01]
MTKVARVDLATAPLDMSKSKHQKRSKAEKKVDVQTSTLKARRDQALDATFGLLKGKEILPDDALQFEREMREE